MRVTTGGLIGSGLLLVAGWGIQAAANHSTALAGITVNYPKDGSIFPPDFVPPTMEWRDSEPRAKYWGIEFDFSDGAAAVQGEVAGRAAADRADRRALRQGGGGDAAIAAGRGGRARVQARRGDLGEGQETGR